jgi:hypothetical protein
MKTPNQGANEKSKVGKANSQKKAKIQEPQKVDLGYSDKSKSK